MTAFAFIAAFSIDRAEWKKEIGVWAQPLRGKGYDSAPSSSLPFQSSSIRRGLHSHKMQRKKQETLSHFVYVVSFAAGHSKTLTSSADERFMTVSQKSDRVRQITQISMLGKRTGFSVWNLLHK